MLNPGICKRCFKCLDFKGVERDGDSRLLSTPIIDCAILGESISCDAEIPDNCPYITEHVLLEEETSQMYSEWTTELKEEYP